MTTPLELKILTKSHDAVRRYGTTAIFTLYPSAVVDTDNSTVTPGSPTTHTVRITPPEKLEQKFSSDGSLIEDEGVSFYISTGALTPDAIQFTPAIGQEVEVRGKDYRVRSVEAVCSGDLVALYEVEARA